MLKVLLLIITISINIIIGVPPWMMMTLIGSSIPLAHVNWNIANVVKKLVNEVLHLLIASTLRPFPSTSQNFASFPSSTMIKAKTIVTLPWPYVNLNNKCYPKDIPRPCCGDMVIQPIRIPFIIPPGVWK
jgi:hypothetical protein